MDSHDQLRIQAFLAANDIGGESSIEQMVQVAQAVSKIPWGEGRTIGDVLEHRGVGTCQGKHLVLQACLEELQIPYRTVVGTFRWKEQGILFPPQLQAFLEIFDWVHGHNWVRVKSVSGAWIDLDVTWDPPLAERGFRPLPSSWNGTEGFLSIDHIITRNEGVALEEKKRELIASLTPPQRAHREEFLKALFSWVATVRSR